jgi:hypothetical protein
VLGFVGGTAALLRSLDEPGPAPETGVPGAEDPLVAAVSVLKLPLDVATFDGLLDTLMRRTDVLKAAPQLPLTARLASLMTSDATLRTKATPPSRLDAVTAQGSASTLSNHERGHPWQAGRWLGR